MAKIYMKFAKFFDQHWALTTRMITLFSDFWLQYTIIKCCKNHACDLLYWMLCFSVLWSLYWNYKNFHNTKNMFKKIVDTVFLSGCSLKYTQIL